MSLTQITQNVPRMVETRSGIPVQVEADPNLPRTILKSRDDAWRTGLALRAPPPDILGAYLLLPVLS
jgi:hypothetical protein